VYQQNPSLNIFLPLAFLGVLCFAEKCDVGFCLDVSKLGEKKKGLREKQTPLGHLGNFK